VNAPNRYRLVQRLGAGAAGAVFLADTAEGRVAIREFQSAAPRNNPYWERERLRFLEGGRSAMALQHDSIVPVLDVVDEGGDAFIATEYQEGATLEAALAARRFSPQETNDILGQIARTLDFAHDRALVHGDLKPSAVFVSRQGLKVADFGISPRAHWESGTPMPPFLAHAYLSPEHLEGNVNARSDQYSLAAIAYRMYTGQLPPVQTLAGPPATRVDITPPSRIRPGLPAAIDGPILQALDRDPEKRFESCRKFYGALGAALIAPEESSRGTRGGIYAIAALILLLAGAALAFRILTRHTVKPVETAVVAFKQVPTPSKSSSSTSSQRKHPPTPLKTSASTLSQPIADPAVKKPSPMPVPTATATPTPRSTDTARTVSAAYSPPPPPPSPAPIPSSATTPRNVTIEVFSRTHRIEEGSSFSFNDSELGELGQYDLKAVASGDWQPPARAQLRLEWSIDGVPMDSAAVTLAKLIEYRNEPTPGTYKLTLKLDGKPLQSFSFRITP
jgi:serine/threonine protein kinase